MLQLSRGTTGFEESEGNLEDFYHAATILKTCLPRRLPCCQVATNTTAHFVDSESRMCAYTAYPCVFHDILFTQLTDGCPGRINGYCASFFGDFFSTACITVLNYRNSSASVRGILSSTFTREPIHRSIPGI